MASLCIVLHSDGTMAPSCVLSVLRVICLPDMNRFLLSHNRHRTWWWSPGCRSNQGRYRRCRWLWECGLPEGSSPACLRRTQKKITMIAELGFLFHTLHTAPLMLKKMNKTVVAWMVSGEQQKYWTHAYRFTYTTANNADIQLKLWNANKPNVLFSAN